MHEIQSVSGVRPPSSVSYVTDRVFDLRLGVICFQIKLQPGIRRIRHNSHVGPRRPDVEEVYNILDKVLHLSKIPASHATGTVQNECQVHSRLAN